MEDGEPTLFTRRSGTELFALLFLVAMNLYVNIFYEVGTNPVRGLFDIPSDMVKAMIFGGAVLALYVIAAFSKKMFEWLNFPKVTLEIPQIIKSASIVIRGALNYLALSVAGNSELVLRKFSNVISAFTRGVNRSFLGGILRSIIVRKETVSENIDTLVRSRSEQSNSRSEIVAQNYLRSVQVHSLIAILALAALLFFTLSKADWRASAFLAFMVFLLAAHLGLTRYRIKKGIFGSNEVEACELISYIFEQTKATGRPPGRRVSYPYSSQAKNQTATSSQAAGVRT